MAPSSAVLALKVAAVLAMLVVPSLGRCGHSPVPPSPLPAPTPPPPPAPTPPPPAPLPPTSAPAPGPGPTISCDDCSSQCNSTCAAFVVAKCGGYCDGVQGSCDACTTRALESCKARGNCTGFCDCYKHASYTCTTPCSTCDSCTFERGQECRDNCDKLCSAPNCIPSSHVN